MNNTGKNQLGEIKPSTSNRSIGTSFLTQSMYVGTTDNKQNSKKHRRVSSYIDPDTLKSDLNKDSNVKSGKLKNSMYGTRNTTKTFYKTKELKMEKFLDKKNDNLILYYKSGTKLFEGTIATNSSTIEEGSWYYPNGKVYYCGTFNKQGYPEGDKCILYYENGQKKFVGKIEKQKVEVYIPYFKRKDSDSIEDLDS